MFLLCVQYNLYQMPSAKAGTDASQGQWWGCELEDEQRGEPLGDFVADACHWREACY